MSKRSILSRNESLRVMRHLADVAALRTDPVKQRQVLVDGLNQIFDTSLGWFFVFDRCRPGQRLRPVQAVIAGEHLPVWTQYCADFIKHVGYAGDYYANAIIHSDATEQQWTRSQLLTGPAEHRKYSPAVQVGSELGIGGDAVCAWRCGGTGDCVAGFSLHRFRNDPRMTERDRALHRFALTETRLMAERGLLTLADPTPADLPPRLKQVLDGLLQGLSPKQIAAGLELSQWTVREHIQRLYVRFGVNSREELMAAYIVRDQA